MSRYFGILMTFISTFLSRSQYKFDLSEKLKNLEWPQLNICSYICFFMNINKKNNVTNKKQICHLTFTAATATLWQKLRGDHHRQEKGMEQNWCFPGCHNYSSLKLTSNIFVPIRIEKKPKTQLVPKGLYPCIQHVPWFENTLFLFLSILI